MHAKIQLPGIKGTQVMTSKRNAEVNVNVNLNVKHLLDSSYKRDIRMLGRNIMANRCMPHCSFGRRGHKNSWDHHLFKGDVYFFKGGNPFKTILAPFWKKWVCSQRKEFAPTRSKCFLLRVWQVSDLAVKVNRQTGSNPFEELSKEPILSVLCSNSGQKYDPWREKGTTILLITTPISHVNP